MIDNLESAELNDFKEVIIQLTRAENDLEPDSRLKTELLQQFKKIETNDTKQTSKRTTSFFEILLSQSSGGSFGIVWFRNNALFYK
ncbi:hypothetical protein N8371_03955 [Vicingaceae bacterium]|nr:hypothetical protein [Vicingaceae bacterium]MDB4083121.1 hypothetical protein [Vicingaceae bacterium]MDC1451550.1 hypothetical protein [Vicingaceae bacterium]